MIFLESKVPADVDWARFGISLITRHRPINVFLVSILAYRKSKWYKRTLKIIAYLIGRVLQYGCLHSRCYHARR